MHDVILCVIVSMATEKEAKQPQQRTKQKGAMQEGERSNKAQCGNRGSPSQDPRDHREQRECEKLKKVKQEVRHDQM